MPYTAIGANTARVFAFPTTLGIEHRIVNGRVYITANPVTDPDEIARCNAVFAERAGYYYQNWDRLYEQWKGRMQDLINQIEQIEVPRLPEVDDPEVVTPVCWGTPFHLELGAPATTRALPADRQDAARQGVVGSPHSS